MTPTHILQYEERIRREKLGLPPEDHWGIESNTPMCMKLPNTLSTLNSKVKNKWKDIKKGKK